MKVKTIQDAKASLSVIRQHQLIANNSLNPFVQADAAKKATNHAVEIIEFLINSLDSGVNNG